mmetsp:Transcript_113240/g.283573  ORF Transcript_113240/g.283573 Transcript_113240/m.283573 type:complete len:221 (+) Transcript_113240:696-1358(+)
MGKSAWGREHKIPQLDPLRCQRDAASGPEPAAPMCELVSPCWPLPCGAASRTLPFGPSDHRALSRKPCRSCTGPGHSEQGFPLLLACLGQIHSTYQKQVLCLREVAAAATSAPHLSNELLLSSNAFWQHGQLIRYGCFLKAQVLSFLLHAAQQTCHAPCARGQASLQSKPSPLQHPQQVYQRCELASGLGCDLQSSQRQELGLLGWERSLPSRSAPGSAQ